MNLEGEYRPPALPPAVPDPETVSSYNGDRQLVSITRPDGATIGFTYDTGGRLSTQTFSGTSITSTYHGQTGLLSSLTTPNVALSLTYDGSLLTNETWSGAVTGSVTHSYDNNFRVSSEQINGGNSVTFLYDDDGFLTNAGALTIQRDPATGLISRDDTRARD